MADDKILNLDELFGVSDPIQVRYQDKVYDLIRPSAFSPLQLMQWQKLQNDYRTAMTTVSKRGKGNDAEMSAALEKIVNGSLAIICPEMQTATMPFLIKLAALKHYNEQTASQTKPVAPGSKKKKRTGANSSRG